MILGIGTDLVDTRRIATLLEKHQHIALSKLMLPQEIEFYKKRKNNDLGFAKMWACKEAMIKAIGELPNLSWHSLEVCHTVYGSPFGKIHVPVKNLFLSKVSNRIGKLAKESALSIFLTLSDELPYVLATCVIEYND